MTKSGADGVPFGREPEVQHLSPNVAVLGIVSLLMGVSSAMIYGLLPVFLITALGASPASVGLIEGIAEATTSFVKIFSGVASDWIGRRKSLVAVGYAISTFSKLIFPLAATAGMVLAGRVSDRIGKGMRDAPRDALMADIVPTEIRGRGFGLRLALYTIGAVAGPLAAMAIMSVSGGDFRLVFWIALLPAAASVLVLIVGVKEPVSRSLGVWRFPIRWNKVLRMPPALWWAIAIASIFALARFSPAFLVLQAHHIGVGAAYVPAILMVMYLVYSAAAYPFGLLADRSSRHLQLAAGALLLVLADAVFASAETWAMTLLGAALWGLQMGMTQGLLSALVADAAPERLRGTAFGIYDFAVGICTFLASAGAGAIWAAFGPSWSFLTGALFALGALTLLMLPALKRDCGGRT